MKLLHKFVVGYDFVIDRAAFLAGVIMIYIVLQITLEVVLRYAFDYTFLWQMELIEFMMVVMCFLVASWVLKVEAHVNMDLVINKLKPRTQHALQGILSILMAVMCLICGYYAVETSLVHFQEKLYIPLLLNIPTWIYIAFVALGMVLLLIQSVRRATKNLRAWRMSSET